VLLQLTGVPGAVVHTEVCEDLWVPIPPGTMAALNGATVLANLSASNVTVGKFEYRRELVRTSAAKNLAAQLYTAACFGESTTDLAWDGHGIIADRGEILAETPRFARGGSVAIGDVDVAALLSDRMRQTSWGENASAFRRSMRVVPVALPADTRPSTTFHRIERTIPPLPFVPADPTTLDDRCHEIFLIMATSLARRIEALPASSQRVVLGVSGGRDSTLALLVACRALDLARLPRAHLIAVTMPGFGTTGATRSAARELATAVGATLREIDISPLANGVFEAIGHDAEDEDTTFENVQAWARKFLLFSVSSKEKGIDLGTGDLSEMALGWSTYGGDHMSHYGVNAGVPKTLVSELIRWAASVPFRDDAAVAAALGRVLAIPISPELKRPGPGGAVTQLSESVIGPYDLQDFFLYHFTRFGFRPTRIARMALQAFDGRYEIGEIRRWLIVFLQRFFAYQFKRDTTPGSPKVGSGGSLSPRGDWRMPAEASPDAWLADAALTPER
jgi:NAD+ synthase (glutamine-hydrolysing)